MCYAIQVHSIISRFTSFLSIHRNVSSSDVATCSPEWIIRPFFFGSENSIKSSVPWFAYRAPLRLLLAMDARVFPPILSFSLISSFSLFHTFQNNLTVDRYPTYTRVTLNSDAHSAITHSSLIPWFPKLPQILSSKIDCATSAARQQILKNSHLFKKGEHRLCLIWKLNRYPPATI